MTPDEIIEMAEEAGVAFASDDYPEIWATYMHVGKKELVAFANFVAAKALAEHAMRETQRLGQEIEQEPPKYSFKAHWEKDGRIGVVGAVVRPDGGVHLLQDFIDPPQRKPLTHKEIWNAIRPLTQSDAVCMSLVQISMDEYRAIEAAHGIKETT